MFDLVERGRSSAFNTLSIPFKRLPFYTTVGATKARGRMNPVSLKVTKFSNKNSRDFQKMPSFPALSVCDYHCTGQVTSMMGMFEHAETFNSNLNTWDTGPSISNSNIALLFVKMAQHLDLGCVLVLAPWVLGAKHVSNPD